MLKLVRGLQERFYKATLFGRDYKTISKYVNNALKEELADEVGVAKFANTTQQGAIEGKTQMYVLEYFNLGMVAAVGYRAKSAFLQMIHHFPPSVSIFLNFPNTLCCW